MPLAKNEAVLEVMIPYYLADIVDLGINAGNLAVVRSVGLKLIFLAFCSLMCGIGGGWVSATASAPPVPSSASRKSSTSVACPAGMSGGAVEFRFAAPAK